MLIIDDLGLSHSYSENAKLLPKMLTTHESGELIRRAALKLGVIPEPEYIVHNQNTGNKRKIDWVWLDALTRSPVAAFEIEGADCPQVAVDKDIESLSSIICPFKYVFLYQARRDTALDCLEIMESNITELRSLNIEIIYDIHMMNGGMDKLLEEVESDLKVAY